MAHNHTFIYWSKVSFFTDFSAQTESGLSNYGGGPYIVSHLLHKPLSTSGIKSGVGTIHPIAEAPLSTCLGVAFATVASSKGLAPDLLAIGCSATMARAVASVAFPSPVISTEGTSTYPFSCCIYTATGLRLLPYKKQHWGEGASPAPTGWLLCHQDYSQFHCLLSRDAGGCDFVLFFVRYWQRFQSQKSYTAALSAAMLEGVTRSFTSAASATSP